MPQREVAGLAPEVARQDLDPALAAYDRALDAKTRAVILPPPPPTGPGALEGRLLGYKYEPLLPLATLPLAAMGWPAGVMAINALAVAATLAALYAPLALVTSATFHNNYAPWASVWIVATLVERFGPPFAARPAASGRARLAQDGFAL